LGIEPDILVFSKTSGNGFPSAGVVISERINDRLIDSGFHHLSSHQNDPLTACAVSAVIEVISSEGLLESSRKNGDYFIARTARTRWSSSAFGAYPRSRLDDCLRVAEGSGIW
jgi:acetylornithine aminotransferase